MHWPLRCLCALLAAVCLVVPAYAQKRIALVIGIDAYQHLPPLQKAVGDARAVAALLKDELGFTVLASENPTRSQMARKLAELDGVVAAGDTVLFFFAGHGVALSTSENVLLPADIASPGPGQEGLVRDDGFAVDGIIRRIQQRGATVALMILDACRDNPFEQAGVRSIGVTRGLARVDAPQGVFVLFSAGLGQKALDRLSSDDASPTSVFTRHLIPALQTPGLSHVQIAKRVQQEVSALARTVSHAQQPAYYDQIEGDVILRGGAAATAAASIRPPIALPRAPAPVAPPAAAELVPYLGEWKGTATVGSDTVEYSWFIEQGEQPRGVKGTITLARPDGTARTTYAFTGTVSESRLVFRGTTWLSGDREAFCMAAGTLDLRMVRNFGVVAAASLTGTWGPNAVAGGCAAGTKGTVRLAKIVGRP